VAWRRFRHELMGRLAAFELEVEPTQTGVLRFGSQAEQDGHKDGRCRPETFNFLGHSRKGRFGVGHKTQGKRFGKKLKGLNQRLRVAGGKALREYFQHPIRGPILDSGVSGNSRWLTRYVDFATKLLFKGLNRRSQRRSIYWVHLKELIKQWLPRIRIVHHLYPTPLYRA
jgi:RNA-directed DNA polymerase